MRQLFILLAGLLLSASLIAADAPKMPENITLKNGVTMRKVSIVKINTDSVVIKHLGGIDRVRLDALPPEVLALLSQEKDRQQTASDSVTRYSGEIFVTTNGGSNVALGGAMVAVYTAHLRETVIAGIKQAVEDAKTAQRSIHFPDLGEMNRKLEEGRKRVRDSLPAAIATTHTDSKGAFNFTAKPNDFGCIVVFESRLAGRDTEHYVWVIDRADVTDPSRITLGNYNLLSTD